MKIFHNVGTPDRMIRGVLGLALVGLGGFGLVTGWAAIAAYVVAMVLLSTAAAGFCPAYWLLGINTCAVKPAVKGRLP
jgi:hypothetical protein